MRKAEGSKTVEREKKKKKRLCSLKTRREGKLCVGRKERRNGQEEGEGSEGKGIRELRRTLRYGISDRGNKGAQVTGIQVRRRYLAGVS